jgi:hypothetical protein
MPFIRLIINLILAVIVIVVIASLIWFFFFKGNSSESFIEFDDCDRSVRPWWWYQHMRDNLYFTPTYAYQKLFYDGRPHNNWHQKYRPYNNDRFYKRKLGGSRHGSRHGPNQGKLRQ